MRPTPALEMNFAVPFVVPNAPMLMAKVSADTVSAVTVGSRASWTAVHRPTSRKTAASSARVLTWSQNVMAMSRPVIAPSA